MNFEGRWITRNGTLVACHTISDITEGEIVRWRGHTIPVDSKVRLDFKWNKNGECVMVMGGIGGTVDDANPTWADLMERITGKDRGENSLKVEGCKECENG